jgi:hypothetical protein
LTTMEWTTSATANTPKSLGASRRATTTPWANCPKRDTATSRVLHAAPRRTCWPRVGPGGGPTGSAEFASVDVTRRSGANGASGRDPRDPGRLGARSPAGCAGSAGAGVHVQEARRLRVASG